MSFSSLGENRYIDLGSSNLNRETARTCLEHKGFSRCEDDEAMDRALLDSTAENAEVVMVYYVHYSWGAVRLYPNNVKDIPEFVPDRQQRQGFYMVK